MALPAAADVRLPGAVEAGSRLSFNAGWRFARFGEQADGSKVAEPAGLEVPTFDDKQWRQLDLPHDWGIEGPFKIELPGETGKLPWFGIGWYRKVFTVPAVAKGKRIFLDFDGAMSDSTVFLNGEKVGGWPYGYSSYCVTVTVVDKDGLMVPRSKNLVHFTLGGPGEIVAVDNGDATSLEPFIARQMKAYNGLCLVIVRATGPGAITLTASADGLASAKVAVSGNLPLNNTQQC
jgi:hypothetical protein